MNLSLRAKRGNLVTMGFDSQATRSPRRFAPRDDKQTGYVRGAVRATVAHRPPCIYYCASPAPAQQARAAHPLGMVGHCDGIEAQKHLLRLVRRFRLRHGDAGRVGRPVLLRRVPASDDRGVRLEPGHPVAGLRHHLHDLRSAAAAGRIPGRPVRRQVGLSERRGHHGLHAGAAAHGQHPVAAVPGVRRDEHRHHPGHRAHPDQDRQPVVPDPPRTDPGDQRRSRLHGRDAAGAGHFRLPGPAGLARGVPVPRPPAAGGDLSPRGVPDQKPTRGQGLAALRSASRRRRRI